MNSRPSAQPTLLFFASLDEEQLQETGTANNNVMSVAGLGFVCAGHVAHHMRIIRERYLDTGKKEEKIKDTKPKEEKAKAKKIKAPKVKKDKKKKKTAGTKFKKQKKPIK